MNFGQLQNYAMNAAKRYADRETIKTHLNEAYLHACLAAHTNRASATVTLPASTTGDYNLATDLGVTDLAALRYVTWFGSSSVASLPLSSMTPDGILNLRMAMPSSAWVWTYAYDPPGTLMLYPTGGGGDQVTLYYYARPPLLDLDEDTPDALPAEYHRVIAHGAIAEAAIENPAVSQAYTARYEQGIRQLRAWASTSDSALPQTMTDARREFVPHDRSTDSGG